MSKNRVFVIGVVLGLVVGAGAATAWFTLGPGPEEQARPEAHAPKPPEILPSPLEDARRTVALVGCKNLATAVQAFATNPANPDWTIPRELGDLVRPPFGGPSYLRNGDADLIDPWGQPYRMSARKRDDGVDYALISTTAPDGTPINQFGIGKMSVPPR